MEVAAMAAVEMAVDAEVTAGADAVIIAEAGVGITGAVAALADGTGIQEKHSEMVSVMVMMPVSVMDSGKDGMMTAGQADLVVLDGREINSSSLGVLCLDRHWNVPETAQIIHTALAFYLAVCNLAMLPAERYKLRGDLVHDCYAFGLVFLVCKIDKILKWFAAVRLAGVPPVCTRIPCHGSRLLFCEIVRHCVQDSL